MFDPRALFHALDRSFEAYALEGFRRNERAHARAATKWLVAADYCLGDPSRPNDSLAFSLIPYDAYFPVLARELGIALPRDLKKTKAIDHAALCALRSSRRFHVCFVIPKRPVVFSDGAPGDERDVARKHLARWLTHFESKEGESPPGAIAKVRKLARESRAKRFNVARFTSLYLLHFFFSYLTLLLYRYCGAEVIGWFSDRDALVSWCEGVRWTLALETFRGLAKEIGLQTDEVRILIGLPPSAQNARAMWYDEIIRVPDYFAGFFAALASQGRFVVVPSEKFRQMAQQVVVDNSNAVTFRPELGGNGIGFSRLLLTGTPALEP